MLSPEEREILEYLQQLGNQYVSAKEVCRRAGGKMKFIKEPEWAKSVLKRMERKGLLEMNAIGHYRIKPPEDDPKPAKKRTFPVSPQLQKILSQSGKDFGHVFILEDPDSPASAPGKTKKRK